MQLKLFDILSLVIPGALVFFCLLLTSIFPQVNLELMEKKIIVYKDVTIILTTIFIVVSYLLGYIIHAIGSWIEPILWKTWGGRPSQILFSNNSTRIGLGSERDAIFTWLKSKSTNSRFSDLEMSKLQGDDFAKLFQIAKNLAFANAGSNFKSRIEEFNNTYIFSRNILVAFIIVLGCVISLCWYKVVPFLWAFFTLVIVLIVWWRARDRAIYYSREILVAGYFSAKESNNKT